MAADPCVAVAVTKNPGAARAAAEYAVAALAMAAHAGAAAADAGYASARTFAKSIRVWGAACAGDPYPWPCAPALAQDG